MTNQEAFTTMVLHLRKQGKRSTMKNRSTCRYYGPDGLMCAVGCLIPEDEYRCSFEGNAVGVIQDKVPSIYSLNTGLLSDMQETHDYVDIEDWEESFSDIAKEYNLTLPPLEATNA